MWQMEKQLKESFKAWISSNRIFKDWFLQTLWPLTHLMTLSEPPKIWMVGMFLWMSQHRRSFSAASSAKLFEPEPKPTEALMRWSWFSWMTIPAPALLFWKAPSKNAQGIPSFNWISLICLGGGFVSGFFHISFTVLLPPVGPCLVHISSRPDKAFI